MAGARFDGTSWGFPTIVNGTTAAVDVALTYLPSNGHGVGLVQTLASSGQALLSTQWTGSNWSMLQQLNSDTTQGRPTITALGDTATAVYWGLDFKYYSESFGASTFWTTGPTAVIPAGASSQPCGPSPGALASLAAGPSFLFVNGNCSGTTNHLYETDLVGAAWQASADVAPTPSYAANQTPALAAPESGPELVAAFIQQGTSQIAFATRTAGVWSSPLSIANALSNDPLALAPVTGGGVMLAFRGTDGNLYWSLYASGAWSAPAPAFSPNVTISTSPALARGIGTAQAEMVYIDGTGQGYHTRYGGGSWSSPVVVPGSSPLARGVIASGP